MSDQSPNGSSQAITVVQPSSPSMTVDIGQLGNWALALAAIVGIVVIFQKWLTKDLKRDISDQSKRIDTLNHDLKNQKQVLLALEHDRNEVITRVVALETSFKAIEKSQARLETGQDKLAESFSDGFGQLSESIRELRTVAPR